MAYHASNILGDSVIETSMGRFLRAYGPFDHPNILGGIMVLGIILVLYSSLQKEINRNSRLFYLISLALFYLALTYVFFPSGLAGLAYERAFYFN